MRSFGWILARTWPYLALFVVVAVLVRYWYIVVPLAAAAAVLIVTMRLLRPKV